MSRSERKYGALMLLGFISYFFLMKALGLYTDINLRVINVLIHFSFVYLGMRAYRKLASEPFEFLATFAVGFRISLLAVIGFAAFQFLYLQFLDPGFMEYVKQNAIMGEYLSPGLASLVLLVEGLGVTIFSSYVGMRILCSVERVPPLS